MKIRLSSVSFVSLVFLFCLTFSHSTAYAQLSTWHQAPGPYSYSSLNQMASASNGYLFAVGAVGSQGYVYRSTDNGATWKLVSPVSFTAAAYAVATDLYGDVFVGTDGQGLWRSMDNGSSWSRTGSALSNQIFSISTDVNGKVYAISGGAIFVSTDKGATWNTYGGQSTPTSLMSISVAPSGYVFIGQNGGTSWYRSTDGGNTWTSLSLWVGGVNPFAFSRSGNIYFASNGNGVYVSTDGGASWNKKNSGLPVLAYGDIPAASVALANDDTILVAIDSLASIGNGYVPDGVGVYTSTDGGDSWRIVGQYFSKFGATSLLASQDGKYIAGAGGVFTYSPTTGVWSQTGLPTSSVIALDVTNSGNWLASDSRYLGLEVSTDDGNNWTYASGFPRTGDAWSFLDALTGKELASGYGGTYLSSDGGLSWTLVTSSFSANSFALTSSGSILAVSSGSSSVVRSTDDGDTWVQMPQVNASLHSIANGGSGNILLGCDSPARMFRSTDDGLTWNISDTLQGSEVTSISNDNDSVIFAGTDNLLYKSNDHGKNWVVDDDFPARGCVKIVTSTNGFVYVATDTNGIIASFDYGLTWHSLNDSLINQRILSLATTLDGTLIAGTDGSGIFFATAPSLPFLTYSIDTLSFGDISAGTSRSQSLVIKNSGTAPLSVYKLTSTDSAYTVSPSSFSLAPGLSQLILVTFRPERNMEYDDSLLISSNFPGALKPIILKASSTQLQTGISLISPLGGQQWYSGTTHNIQWSSSNISLIKIEFSSDSGATWTIIADSVQASQDSLAWLVPDINSSNCFVKVVSLTDSTYTSQSSSPFQIARQLNSPGWTYTITGNNHIILIPLSANPTINDTAIAGGDYIGVFYDSSGTLACGGYAIWDGTRNISVTAWGDDPTSPNPDGFGNGEVFKWRIWQHKTGKTFFAHATYTINPQFPNDSTFVSNGISALASLNGYQPITAVQESRAIPEEYALYQNYPNPFNPTTMISYDLPKRTHVVLTVYDILGRNVMTLVNVVEQPGSYEVNFNASDLPSGVYFYRLTAGSFVATKKLLLLK